VLRRIFGPKGAEVTGELRKQHNEEFNDLFSAPNIIRVIKSPRMRWARYVARTNERRGVCTVFWWVNLREGNHLEDPVMVGRIIWKWVFSNWNRGSM